MSNGIGLEIVVLIEDKMALKTRSSRLFQWYRHKALVHTHRHKDAFSSLCVHLPERSFPSPSLSRLVVVPPPLETFRIGRREQVTYKIGNKE